MDMMKAEKSRLHKNYVVKELPCDNIELVTHSSFPGTTMQKKLKFQHFFSFTAPKKAHDFPQLKVYFFIPIRFFVLLFKVSRFVNCARSAQKHKIYLWM